MADPNNYSTQLDAVPQMDTMTQILGRIENLMSHAYENENGLDSILLRVNGPSTSNAILAAADAKSVKSTPSHIIFAAKQIEQRLEAHFSASANAIRRISETL
jgi:hypothetical protein